MTCRQSAAVKKPVNGGSSGEDRKLFTLMKKLRMANEYVRHEKSLFCMRDIAGD
jgi:hypothetical protein